MKRFHITEESRKALLRQAPEFAEIMQKTELNDFQCSENLFFALVQNIVSQQLAVKAADAVFLRLQQLLGTVSAENILKQDMESLRRCGLSMRKAEYLKGIAEAGISGTIDFDSLSEKTDQEIIETLIQLKGVGVWTAEMLLISALGRPDILSYKDLGIRRGIMRLYQLEKLSETDFEYYRKRYTPYGTLASLYLWKIKDGGLDE